MLAYPYACVPAGGTEIASLVALVEAEGPIEVIVGLPRSLSGHEGPAAVKIRGSAVRLAAALASSAVSVPVRLVDERLSTVTAARQLRESGKRSKEQRTLIDAAAATTILEHALAAERAQHRPPGELVSAPGQG